MDPSLLYADFEDEQSESVAQTRPEFDPLQGEGFSLSSLTSRRGGIDNMPSKKIAISEFTASGGAADSYTLRQSPVFFGPPPVHLFGPHTVEAVVIVTRLSRTISDAELRKTAADLFGTVRVVRVVPEVSASGLSSGVAVVEFADASAGVKAVTVGGLLGGTVRRASQVQFDALVAGSFCILDYGPISADVATLLLK